MNPIEIMNMILDGEASEHLAIFPDEKQVFAPYQAAWDKAMFESGRLLGIYGALKSQKEFAQGVVKEPVSQIMFGLRCGQSLSEVLERLSTSAKHRIIEAYL